ncbi:NAD(+) diphosphatase [Azospirillum doebereinerae]|uniref:NAD(+) diphosphatase n=1 Tax=Azospirillum doebereinerae TaxID=92933 RepID=A0A433JDV6_9PROT|nr:NAD(+) diphosphatase [Azospirillum doebereinerae]MCG5239204.1 NAD(+) diphosphatase [Azospirillum doebereinerae]RUQ75082.1 NAD(+) diphosphatase [Azospirillum doebereinerae]
MSDRPNVYAGVPLDRAALRRKNEDWLTQAWLSPDARVLPVWQTRSFVTGPADAARAVLVPPGAGLEGVPIFLGLLGEDPIFAVDLSIAESPESLPGLEGLGRFEDLRAVGPLMPEGEGALCAYARGMAWWNARHRFCGVCGAPAASAEAGHVRICTDPACATHHFPRTDPAVIMLVHDGDRVVLGRQSRFPPGMHSVLAGFVEPGESLEETVAREVMEEVGLSVTDVRYQSSQPWPFPSSLMLGFTARATSFDIETGQDELESAQWYDRAFLRDHSPSEAFRLPRRDSIAHRLLAEWIAAG